MRAVLVAAVMLGGLVPAVAEPAPVGRLPTFQECNALGWVRGVHNEMTEATAGVAGELELWMAQCLKGQIPFDHKAQEVDLPEITKLPAPKPRKRG